MPMAAAAVLDRSGTSSRSNSGASVLSIECLRGGSKADEWTGDMLQTGDIVEELRIGRGYSTVRAPFKNGRTGVQKILHGSFMDKETSILVRVRRGYDAYAELQACIVPNESAGRKHYMLRAIADPNYAVGFLDRTEAECIALQGTRKARLENALAGAQLQDGYVQFGWEKKMQEMLMVPGSSCFLSIIFLPKAADKTASRYNDLEDTLARANAWLNSSQANGVPLVFMNIQTESLLTKISGETASSTVNAGSLTDLSRNLANASLYGFEDYHGVDIGVVRAVRLWYSPIGGEMSIEIKLRDGDTKLGLAISRTEEGFIYISSVIDGDEKAASWRSGLNQLYKEAVRANKRLVISRVCNEKVLPWLVSQMGAIKCFDTVSLSQKLSLHRHAKVPITLHVFMWDRSPHTTTMAEPAPLTVMPVEIPTDGNENQSVTNNSGSQMAVGSENRIERDTAGEFSFRFRDFALENNWV